MTTFGNVAPESAKTVQTDQVKLKAVFLAYLLLNDNIGCLAMLMMKAF